MAFICTCWNYPAVFCGAFLCGAEISIKNYGRFLYYKPALLYYLVANLTAAKASSKVASTTGTFDLI